MTKYWRQLVISIPTFLCWVQIISRNAFGVDLIASWWLVVLNVLSFSASVAFLLLHPSKAWRVTTLFNASLIILIIIIATILPPA